MNPIRIAVAAGCFQQPLRQTLLLAAEIGAQGVQFDARTELKPGDLSDTGRRQFLHLVRELQLSVASLSFSTRRTFYDLDQLDGRIAAIKAVMQFAFQLGVPVVTARVGRIPEDPDSADYQMLQSVMNDIARQSNHVGVTLAIMPCGDAPETLSRLIGDVREGPLGIDFDPAGFVFSRHAVDDALRTLYDSIIHFQVRDGLRDIDSSGREVEVGRGEVDWDEVAGLLDEIAYRSWVTIIRTQGDDKPGDAARAVEYFQQLFL